MRPTLFRKTCWFILTALLAMVSTATSARAQDVPPSRIGGRLATRGDGTIVMFARASDKSVSFGQRIGFTGTGAGVWDAWYALGGTLNSEPVALLNGDSRLLVVGRGTDSKIYQQRETGSGTKVFGGWVQIPHVDANGATVPSFTGDPAAVRTSSGTIALFSVASDGNLWTSRQASMGGAFGAYSSLGSPPKKFASRSPLVALSNNGGLLAFAVGLDKNVWYSNLPPGGSWSSWMSLGLGVQMINSTDSLASNVNANGRLSLFMNNAASTMSFVTQTALDSTSFTPWANLVGGEHGLSRPAAIRNSDGRITVFFWANYGTALVYQSQTAANATTWNNWTTLQSPVNSSPVGILDVNGRIHVMALDPSGGLHEVVQTTPNDATFTSWSSGLLPGVFNSL